MKIINYKKINLEENSLKLIETAWNYASARSTDLFLVEYFSDDLKVKGYYSIPKEIHGKLPVIFWLRGGYGENGAINNFNAKGIFGFLASRNFAVLAPQYRGALGSEGVDEFGGRDVADIINFYECFKASGEFDYIDFEKTAIIGWSRGGMMAFLLMKNFDFVPKAVAIVGGLTNLFSIENDRIVASKKLLKKIYANYNDSQIENLMLESSAINFIDKLPHSTKYFLIHGAKDERISIFDALEMYRNMLERNFSSRFLCFENGDHFLKKFRKELDFILVDWLNSKLN